MIKFLLIRHATTDAVGKYLSGRKAGVHLNEEGINQAQQLAKRLADVPLTAIYSSPLERALETAAPIAALLNLAVHQSNDFLEMDFGEWTNRSIKEVEKEREFGLFNSFRSFTRVPGGEMMIEAQTRIVTGMEKLRSDGQQGVVAVFSHADLIRAALAHYAGVHLDMFQRLEISPASVSILDMYDETVRLLLVNDTGTLHK